MSMLSDLPPGLTGLEQLRALIASGRQPPILETLDIALIAADHGEVIIEAMPGERHLNPAGIVHGGYASVMLDTACGCAVHSALAADRAYSTIELKVSFHRPMTTTTGRVRTTGRLVSLGRTVGYADAQLHDEAGKLLASATSSLLVMPLKR